MKSIEGFILAGGESSRMGRDKARLLFDGRTFIEQIAGELNRIACSVVVIGQNADDLRLPSAADVFKKWGALGGIHAALVKCRAEWAAITACDLPFVTAGLFERLASLRDGFDAVAPVQPDGFVQPLCALYRVETCLPRAEVLIKGNERRPISMLESVNTRWVAYRELADLEGAERFFDNINTPDDYVRVNK
jgi:molybdopterin-guanine dinucleotide biosynthesis protein A